MCLAYNFANRCITVRAPCSMRYQFKFSLYLDGIQVKKYSTAMSRLRLSSHRLAVESGRWYKPLPISFNERKCTICNVLQDEFHFVIEYNLCKDLSNRLVESKPKIRDNLCVWTQKCLGVNTTLKNFFDLETS